jgi:hypothetical protein
MGGLVIENDISPEKRSPDVGAGALACPYWTAGAAVSTQKRSQLRISNGLFLII